MVMILVDGWWLVDNDVQEYLAPMPKKNQPSFAKCLAFFGNTSVTSMKSIRPAEKIRFRESRIRAVGFSSMPAKQ
jgi:hypothetical protein